MDLSLVASAWLGAYFLRFHSELGTKLFGPPLEAVPPQPYALVLLLIIPLWFQSFRARGLYGLALAGRLGAELFAVLRACGVAMLLLIAATFFFRSYFYSRAVIASFAFLSTPLLLIARGLVHSYREHWWADPERAEPTLVVGDGELAETVVERVRDPARSGVRLIGVVGDQVGPRKEDVLGIPVLGGYAELKSVIQKSDARQVILAVPRQSTARLEKIFCELDDEMITLRLVPDLLNVLTVRSSVDEFAGLPIINLRESPLQGWAGLQKRAFDIAVSGLALFMLSPLFLLITFAVRTFMGRPVLYRQERMGLDGKVFNMLKFRTMVPEAERDSGPVWTTAEDPRRTRLGSFLRATSLDEFPQLWNVLRGDMSLVGPRPERPVFIEEFRREIPGYMLRHQVKAGVTGWAQVNGWRGNTSLQERIEHDIHYIQNWSFGLDLRILWLTVWKGFVHRNAY